MIFQFLINGLITGSIYALAALGFALVYNTTRIFHVAYSVLYITAPYMLLSFYKHYQLPLILSILLALSVTILLSILIELLIYRPLLTKKSSLNVIMISSIGVMIIILNLIAILYGNETRVLSEKLSILHTFQFFTITEAQLTQFSISILLISSFLIILKFSLIGVMSRGLRDDPELCRVFALNISLIRIFIFGLSGLFVGCSGILIGWDLGMDPYIGMPLLLNSIVALIIGGIGGFYAPVLGGFLIGILQSITMYLFSANWQDAVTFALLLIFLFLMPQGIFGEKLRKI